MNYTQLIKLLGDLENISDFTIDTNRLTVKLEDISEVDYKSLDELTTVTSITLKDHSMTLIFQEET